MLIFNLFKIHGFQQLNTGISVLKNWLASQDWDLGTESLPCAESIKTAASTGPELGLLLTVTPGPTVHFTAVIKHLISHLI